MFDGDEVVDRVIEQLRRPVGIDPALDARVLREISATPRAKSRMRWPWLAAAAVLVAIAVARPWTRGGGDRTPFQFVIVAPQAATVALVGAFNDWDPKRAPMQSAHGV